MRTLWAFATFLIAPLVAAAPVWSQNLIAQDGWQGFAICAADGKFDRCVLYNRTIEALNASPYDMLGVSRDAAGNLGLIVFFEPRALTRGRALPVSLKLDQQAPVSLTGDAVSDFHVVIAGPSQAGTLAALRQATSIEVAVEDKTGRFAVTGLAAVLDQLTTCVSTYAR